jgi:alkanesulfonate monooxygenase SsuD/methylene tetrahydromethanopterin reductase-like flavin-dependent oxidoreductase (luciferase family)
MQLNLRYDMNSPPFGAPHPVLSRTAIEQSVWADKLGFNQVFLAEHHGAEHGYCPSSMVQAAGVLLVGLHRHGLEGGSYVARLQQLHR